MGSVEEEEQTSESFKTLLSALRSERSKCKRETWESAHTAAHGSSSSAASSRMSERTPDPFLFLGGFRTHAHRLGAHGGK